jgi:tRNA 2-selenouridine synthase
MISIDSKELSGLIGKVPIVDVRSPGEFQHGHITSAFNIPLFNNEERAIIGKLYVQSGRKDAINKGLEISGPKLYHFVQAALDIANENKVIVYCWRGGMRSEKMAWLFETAGLECLVLKGGYKAYRKQLFEDFKNLENLVVINGPTGCGKTEIINELGKRAEQVIDLEYLARHRGSAFGDIGLEAQPTSMQFQNDLYNYFLKLNKSKRTWIEGESVNIGKVYLPETLWEKMNKAVVINLVMPRKLRVGRILKEYGKFPKHVLSEAVLKIQKRFGNDRTKLALKLIEEDKLSEAVEILLDYYDKNYSYSLENFREGKIMNLDTRTENASENAEILLSKINEIQK